jgi:hypothetical protein
MQRGCNICVIAHLNHTSNSRTAEAAGIVHMPAALDPMGLGHCRLALRLGGQGRQEAGAILDRYRVRRQRRDIHRRAPSAQSERRDADKKASLRLHRRAFAIAASHAVMSFIGPRYAEHTNIGQTREIDRAIGLAVPYMTP